MTNRETLSSRAADVPILRFILSAVIVQPLWTADFAVSASTNQDSITEDRLLNIIITKNNNFNLSSAVYIDVFVEGTKIQD